ncbi:MAG: GHKL domain-containing protein [Chitinophagaceae bacterium]|nr:GHKL domain-containing protein [Chitinophagaceae bacterium]
MRSVEDLDRLIPLIWNELHILQIPFIRCGIFIMNEQEQTINTFLSTPDGRSIASFPLSYQASTNISDVVSHWQRGELYIDQWGIDAFYSLADSLVERNIIQHREQYLASIPDTGMYLHLVPFLQGMLYVGNMGILSKEELGVLQSVSNAFSTAYARYQDFNNLEAAKKEIEKTLQDLRQTQQQLVQAEKMASLGELTAGIAHEIQNPLNFVNNFSEVSQELIDEMKAELANGNFNDAEQLATDIKENLNKIHHHGKRADAIVKGMLQHSRTSTGKKESTDINALCDEYLRLAYHGLRAKDKSFNAKFETKLDPQVGVLDIVPQDIGRVLLNLINNAFYATDERKKKEAVGYEPMVMIETGKIDDFVTISVTDNGMGIPDAIKEKIFQPFFTTKPTGQGTGLGLSLSYDIVKAHKGELKVETKEGKGTKFVLSIKILNG